MDNRSFSAAKFEHNSGPPALNFCHIFEARFDIFSIFFGEKEVLSHLADDDSTVRICWSFFPGRHRGFAALHRRNERKNDASSGKNASFIPAFRRKNWHFCWKRPWKKAQNFREKKPFRTHLTLKMPLLRTPENLLKITKTGSFGPDEAAILLYKGTGIWVTTCYGRIAVPAPRIDQLYDPGGPELRSNFASNWDLLDLPMQ